MVESDMFFTSILEGVMGVIWVLCEVFSWFEVLLIGVKKGVTVISLYDAVLYIQDMLMLNIK